MNKKLFSSLLLGGLLVLTGCSKKLAPMSADYYKTNPTPLEVVGDKVPAVVTGQIPAKYFVKNAEVTVTPTLVYGDKEQTSVPYRLQGENVRGNNQVVSYEYGGTVTIPVGYTYDPAMLNSHLWLDFQVQQGNKTYVLPRVKVADGVIATATLADATTVTPAASEDKFERIIKEKVDADINFLINQTNIRSSELNKSEITDWQKTLTDAQGNEKLQIEEINISSYASPEGGVELNTRIAEGREKSTQEYLNKELKKNQVTDFGSLTADFTPQDWEGFQRLVSESDIQDKDLILSVLAMYKDPEQREKEIRNLSSVFDQLAIDVLPKLRYSRLSASINVIGKSDEELKDAYKSNPKDLTVEELLYFATLAKTNDERMSIYDTITAIYPNDYRAYNNLGMCQYIDKDYDAAAANFAHAARIAPADSKEATMNEGLISLLNKDYRKANELFGSATGVSEIGDALGVYYMKIGDAKAAVNAFGETKNNNSALAQILTKDYNAARSTLASISNPDATTYYLMAVLGARTNNEQMVTSNLRQAVKLDSSYATRAKNDLEFARFNLSSVL